MPEEVTGSKGAENEKNKAIFRLNCLEANSKGIGISKLCGQAGADTHSIHISFLPG